MIEKEPIKYGLLIRFASLPVIIKNYGLSVMPISYYNYMICVLA